jgi:single-strand DNA-binding protein
VIFGVKNMARGVNKVILIGNLGADPEVRYTTDGQPIVTIRIATSESWKDKLSGELQERTEWHRVVFYNRLAQIASEYLKKGSKVYVEGSIRTNKWQDQSGQDRYTTQIIANSLQMLDSKGSAGAGGVSSFNAPAVGAPAQNSAAETFSVAANGTDQNFDDEIPF